MSKSRAFDVQIQVSMSKPKYRYQIIVCGLVAGILKYMHCEIGISDVQTKMRQNILNAKIDMDPQAISLAMNAARKEGLSIPDSADVTAVVADPTASVSDVQTNAKGGDISAEVADPKADNTKAAMQQKVWAISGYIYIYTYIPVSGFK